MARIDTLLAQMHAHAVDRAILQGDAPTQFQTSTGTSQGQALTVAEVESIASEILSPDERLQLDNTDFASVVYNGFQVSLNRANGILHLVVTPTQPLTSPTATPAINSMASPVGSLATTPPLMAVTNGPIDGPNNSGQGQNSVVPAEIQSFNWGAFFLSWIWAIAHRAWIGLLALIPVVGLVMCFVLGFKGNEWAWRNRHYPSVADFKRAQKSWAIAGLVLVLGSVLLMPIWAAIFFPVFARARENARRSSCQNNLKQISLAVMQWSSAHGDKYPAPTSDDNLRDIVKPFTPTPEVFECRSDTVEDGASDYQYNRQLAGLDLTEVSNPARTPMLWDKPSIDHLDGGNIAFADGHVKWFGKSEFNSLIQPFAQ
jgi:prepilin-type processing-associated H-X9-DG protein